MGREKIKKCRENLSVLVPPKPRNGVRDKLRGGGRKRTDLFWILFKESSNFIQKTPPFFTFCEIVRGCFGAKRLGMVFFRYFKGIFEIAASVRSAIRKFTERSSGKMKFCKPIFFLSPLAKG